MERLRMKRWIAWKNSPYRKPLILKGGRQNIKLVQLKAIKKILDASWEDLLE